MSYHSYIFLQSFSFQSCELLSICYPSFSFKFSVFTGLDSYLLFFPNTLRSYKHFSFFFGILILLDSCVHLPPAPPPSEIASHPFSSFVLSHQHRNVSQLLSSRNMKVEGNVRDCFFQRSYSISSALLPLHTRSLVKHYSGVVQGQTLKNHRVLVQIILFASKFFVTFCFPNHTPLFHIIQTLLFFLYFFSMSRANPWASLLAGASSSLANDTFY